MRNLRPLFCRSTLSLVLLASLTAQAQAQPIERIGWLACCWGSEKGETGSGEQWLPHAGGTMFGIGRTVKGGKTVEYEFLQLRANEQGKLLYTALPSNQKQTTFTEKSFANNEIVFENLQHDFPHRIIYRLESPQKLIARIEGLRTGQPRGIDFPLQRVACGNESK